MLKKDEKFIKNLQELKKYYDDKVSSSWFKRLFFPPMLGQTLKEFNLNNPTDKQVFNCSKAIASGSFLHRLFFKAIRPCWNNIQNYLSNFATTVKSKRIDETERLNKLVEFKAIASTFQWENLITVGDRSPVSVVQFLVSQGNLKGFKYVQKNTRDYIFYPELRKAVPDAIDFAFLSGNLRIINHIEQNLRKNEKIKLNYNALQQRVTTGKFIEVARSGYLDVFKWVNERAHPNKMSEAIKSNNYKVFSIAADKLMASTDSVEQEKYRNLCEWLLDEYVDCLFSKYPEYDAAIIHPWMEKKLLSLHSQCKEGNDAEPITEYEKLLYPFLFHILYCQNNADAVKKFIDLSKLPRVKKSIEGNDILTDYIDRVIKEKTFYHSEETNDNDYDQVAENSDSSSLQNNSIFSGATDLHPRQWRDSINNQPDDLQDRQNDALETTAPSISM